MEEVTAGRGDRLHSTRGPREAGWRPCILNVSVFELRIERTDKRFRNVSMLVIKSEYFYRDRHIFGRTLEWQNADTEVFQLAEGTDEVQFVLDGHGTVCDQLETRPVETITR